MKINVIYDIADFFELGVIKSVDKSSYGYGAKTFFIRNIAEQDYVIKIFGKAHKERIENSISIAAQLKESGVPSIKYLNKDGSFIYGKDLMAVASIKLNGEHLSYETTKKETVMYLLGRAMASYHAAVSAVPHEVSSDLLDSKMIEDVLTTRNDMLSEAFNKAQLYINSLDLPTGIIHGDLYRYNFLINEVDGLHILDLDSSRHAQYVLDIGRSLADVCITRDGSVDHGLIGNFLEGYQSIRPLTTDEKMAIIPAIVYGAIAVMVWAIKRGDIILENQFREVALSCQLD